jgi:PAS domain S-box-containing protein
LARTAQILLVDDQPSSLLVLEAVLAPLEQPVIKAGSGEEALRLMLRESFAVVLMDVRLPGGLSGVETVRMMKQSERTRRLPVIFLSAFPDADAEQLYQAGAVDFLLKPFDPDVLRAKVKVFVDLFREAELQRQREGEAARAEADSQRRLLAPLIEQSLDAILVSDENGVIQLANPAAERMLGKLLVGQNVATWARETEMTDEWGGPLPSAHGALKRALTGASVRQERVWIRHAGGKRHALSLTCTPLARSVGAPEGGAIWVAREETQRLLLEEERNHTLALLDALFAAAPVGLAFVDRQLRYLRVNRMLAEINGSAVEDHLGRAVGEVYPLDHEDGTLEHLHKVLDTGEPVLGVEVCRGRTADDSGPRHLLASYYPVRAVGADVLGVGIVWVEITEQKRSEHELQRTAEFRERFLGAVGHDLRNPLSAILFAAQRLERRDPSTEETLRSAQRIRASADRMSRMIGELLDLTRGRLGGGIPVERQGLDLSALAHEVVDEVHLAHPGRRVELISEGDMQGSWDAVRLSQVLTNLVSNAVRYGAEDAPVQVSLRSEGDQVCLMVHNQGAPIPPERLAHVFEPFERAEARDKSSGLGLGLYIVHQVVLGHGGTVEVTSTEEEGTSFTVRLPRYSVASEDAAPAVGPDA